MARPWPMHPQPLPDELLSSWLIRAAHANGQKLSTLFSIACPTVKNINKNLDGSISDISIIALAQHLRVPLKIAKITTLESYEGLLFERSTPKAKRKLGILHTGSPKHEDHRYYLQYCPECLSEETPYYRKIWRVALITVCIRHGLILLDRCCHCGASVQPIKIQKLSKFSALKNDLSQCYKCGYDLSKCKTQKASGADINIFTEYNNIINRGYVEIKPGLWIYSFSFFSVIRHLMRCVISKNLHSKSRYQSIEIEQLSVDIRHRTLTDIGNILINWPIEFIRYCKANGISFYHLDEVKKSAGICPYWLHKEIEQFLYKPNLSPSIEEVLEAINYLNDKKIKISALRVNKEMGMTDSGIINKVCKNHKLH